MHALLLAAALASRGPDPARLALARVMAGDASGECSANQTKELVRTADISTLGMVNGRRVVLAAVHGSCICGNVNCPYYVLRLDPRGPTVLLSTFAGQIATIGRASPLPNLRELAHDSNLISDETIDAYRGGTYVQIGSARVRGDTGERKPDAVPVHFLPGTTSAVLKGTVSDDWYDEYQLDAAAGRSIAIAGPAGLAYTLVSRSASKSLDLRPGAPARLPAGGSWLLRIDSDGHGTRTYRATVTIR